METLFSQIDSLGWLIAMFLLGSIAGPLVGSTLKCVIGKVAGCCKKGL